MSIVSTPVHSRHVGIGPDRDRALLEVVVLHPRDVPGAQEGGADRLLLLTDPDLGGLTPVRSEVAAVVAESDLPVRVVLRLRDEPSTTGGELTRMAGLASDYRALGAEGFCFGFLDDQLRLDTEVCAHLADLLDGAPWTFHRVFDQALETDRAWRDAALLPGLDAVLSAGSARGLDAGHDELTDRAAADPEVADLLMAAGGLRGEHVAWLLRAGVRRFQVAGSVRPGRSWDRAYVDAAHVRSWRTLLDDGVDHLAGRTAG